jgi:hypothetical protein
MGILKAETDHYKQIMALLCRLYRVILPQACSPHFAGPALGFAVVMTGTHVAPICRRDFLEYQEPVVTAVEATACAVDKD